VVQDDRGGFTLTDQLSYRSGPAWHVVYTEQRAEREVAFGLWDAGFDVYLPMERAIRNVRGRRTEVSSPLLPRYLFVSFDALAGSWGCLNDIDGVSGILQNNGMPSRLPMAWVEALQRSESCGIFDRTRIDPNGFEAGDEIRVIEGPFAGHHAIIQAFVSKMKSVTAKKRVVVLMKFLGGLNRAEFDVTEIEKISPSVENNRHAA
jgi:transcription antitermination factor NusG